MTSVKPESGRDSTNQTDCILRLELVFHLYLCQARYLRIYIGVLRSHHPYQLLHTRPELGDATEGWMPDATYKSVV